MVSVAQDVCHVIVQLLDSMIRFRRSRDEDLRKPPGSRDRSPILAGPRERTFLDSPGKGMPIWHCLGESMAQSTNGRD